MTSKTRLPNFSTVLFFITVAALVAGFGWVIAARRALAGRIEATKRELAELNQQGRIRQEQERQYNRDLDVVWDVLRQCRSADDVGALGGDRILSNLNGADAVTFYVPEGGHRLSVDLSWTVTPTNGSANGAGDAAEKDTEIPPGEKTWSVPLLADHAYRFEILDSFQKEAPMQWELSSDAADFETQRQTLPPPPFRSVGASWSGYRQAVFPNQVGIQQLIRQPGSAFVPVPVRIAAWTKRGLGHDNTNIAIKFELSLLSDNPPVLSATDVQTVWNPQRRDLIGEYLGGGRYRARLRNESGNESRGYR
ncbi:hypothetical protein Mal15_04810 [Stieleria maiorica]|uniref:Uncharacterized protein n=1 Tax=Stieleria maiorica TaxID=2795974 RepID=A0A5B9M711_9BACT|nr:hypothetical protein [Stieleria maiorica]QEF96453.1 hypothetical protein Mal15_04810 [Stieleria maiorica]